MSIVVIYKQKSDHARAVEEFLHDFEKRTGRQLDTMDPETAMGSDFCQTYDIVEYPTLVATGNEGAMRNMWRGLPLPTIDEVSYYVQ